MARILKKQTTRAMRESRARVKLSLATVAAIARGCSGQIQENWELGRREKEQIKRVESWADKCLDELEMGIVAGGKAIEKVEKITAMLESELPRPRDRVGEYMIIWLLASYLADEARDRLADEKRKRSWNYLAGCVATCTVMLMQVQEGQASGGHDYELLGGRIAELARQEIFSDLKL